MLACRHTLRSKNLGVSYFQTGICEQELPVSLLFVARQFEQSKTEADGKIQGQHNTR